VFFAAVGNQGLVPAYPSVSPNVVSVGGTSIVRDSNGNFTGEEDCYSRSGGGISLYEPLPQYQLIIGNITGPKRGTPDVAAVADPSTGVDVYATYCGGWCIVGGTGNATTILAGIVNAAGNFYNSSPQQLSREYMEYRNPGIYHQYFYDVTNGNNGSQAKLGWDQCTGLGSPRKLAGF
jgi:kumamolisin